MDEPVLYVRVGASMTLIPLGAVLGMADAAREIANAAILKRDKDAVATVEAVMRQQSVGQAAAAGLILQYYVTKAQELDQARVVVAPAESVAGAEASGPAAGSGAAAPPGPGAAAPAGPCNHPPDTACPNCAASYLEARNAKKRAGARA